MDTIRFAPVSQLSADAANSAEASERSGDGYETNRRYQTDMHSILLFSEMRRHLPIGSRKALRMRRTYKDVNGIVAVGCKTTDSPRRTFDEH